MTPRYAWAHPGWLPAFEVIECDLLEGHRKAHEAAVRAVAGAKGSASAEFEATDNLLAVVETVHRDLEVNFEAAIGEAIEAAEATVRPKPAPESLGGPLEDLEAEAAKVGRRQAAERAKLRPRYEALGRDLRAVTRVRLMIAGDTALYGAAVMPVVRAQVAEARDDLEAVATTP
jgi:hypothetical protein